MDDHKPTLQERMDEYLKLKREQKTLRAQIKDLEEESDLTEDIDNLAKELKVLRLRRATQLEGLDDLTQKLDKAKDRANLLETILLVELKEEQPSLDDKIEGDGITYQGYKFKVGEKLKVSKSNEEK